MLKFRFISDGGRIFERDYDGWPGFYLSQFRESHKYDLSIWSVYVYFEGCGWRLDCAYYYGITYVFDKIVDHLPMKGVARDELRECMSSY